MVLLQASTSIIIYAVIGAAVGVSVGVLLASTVMRKALTRKGNQLLEEAK